MLKLRTSGLKGDEQAQIYASKKTRLCYWTIKITVLYTPRQQPLRFLETVCMSLMKSSEVLIIKYCVILYIYTHYYLPHKIQRWL